MTEASKNVQEPVAVEMEPSRLASGEWCSRRRKMVGRGDVAESYSADRIGEGKPVRKPFEWRGALWISVSGSKAGHRVYRLVDPGIFPEPAVAYGRRVANGDAARADPKGFYHGVTVRHAGREAVLCGPPVALIPGRETQLDLF